MAFELSIRMDRRQPAFRRGVNVLAPMHSRGGLRPSARSGRKRNLRVIQILPIEASGHVYLGSLALLGHNRQQAARGRGDIAWEKIQCSSVSNVFEKIELKCISRNVKRAHGACPSYHITWRKRKKKITSDCVLSPPIIPQGGVRENLGL